MLLTMKKGRSLAQRSHPEVGEYFARIFQTYDNERADTQAEEAWRDLWKKMHACVETAEEHVQKISMDVVKAVIFLQGEPSLWLIFPGARAMRPLDKMPALMSNICTALQVRPAGMPATAPSRSQDPEPQS
jgi:hypothetical protein